MSHQPPNLLFIFTDQQRRDTLSCYGNDFVQMPNLNRFAESACVFDDAHCTDPICTPSRGSLQSGLYPHAHGAYANNLSINADTPCLPELIDPVVRSRYRIEYHGKWHLGDEIYPQHGYERFVSVEDFYFQHFSEGRDRTDRSDYHHHLLQNGFTIGRDPRGVFDRAFAARLPEQFSKAKFLGDQACDFIHRYQNQPWALTVSFLEPHDPFFGPRDQQYDPDQVPMFPGFGQEPGSDGGPLPKPIADRLKQLHENGYGNYDLSYEKTWRELTACYLGLCSLIDTHVGRILDTLHDCGLDDNTIVVFTSDHGEFMGSHGLLLKKLPYREAVRIPLLVRVPGQREAIRINGPVSQIDLVPTLLELMGQSVSSQLHGRSLANALHATHDVDIRGQASPCVISQNYPAIKSRTLVSIDGWRYTNYLTTEEHELYNLNDDPGEHHNLASHAEQLPQMQRLFGQLQQWQTNVNDTLELPEPQLQTA